VVVSPRSYFVFTPLLNSTSVGTLEFRTALEPIRSKSKPNVEFMQGWADDVDFNRKRVTVEENVADMHKTMTEIESNNKDYSAEYSKAKKRDKREQSKQGRKFEVGYDKLVVAVGCYSNTFGTKGVKENAFFMKDILGARKVRKRVLECFEIASLPTTSERLREQLMRFAIVGGGPTGMEFAAELHDLIKEDMVILYPKLAPKVDITVYDVAPTVLSMFEEKLARYAMDTFRREGIKIKTSHHVEELRPGVPRQQGENATEGILDTQGCYTLRTKEDGEIGVGMCVWSTGNMMNPFVQKSLGKVLGLPQNSAEIIEGEITEETGHQDWMIQKNAKTGAIVVDDRLRVQLHTRIPTTSKNKESPPSACRAIMRDVFALGDNAAIVGQTLPVTAQTANQQAIWLGKRLNKGDLQTQTFNFRNMGIMAYLGGWKGLFQTGGGGEISGRMAWLIWRGAYSTMSLSWRNKILIPTYW
jgi:NADH dehydrogenase FAD-containing subunit